MLFEELLVTKVDIYFNSLKDTKLLIFTPKRYDLSILALRYKGLAVD